MILRVSKNRIVQELQNIGVSKISEALMLPKAEIIPLKVLKVRTPAANIIKQEMLACGGECAVNAGTITCEYKHTDILLLGTKKHYKRLIEKLQMMPFFGLEKLTEELIKQLAAQKVQTQLGDGRILDYNHVVVMGILNVTPDSFYAGSRVNHITDVVKRAEKMLVDGAEVLDIGGESTRPGSDAVSQDEELKRVLPVIEALRKEFPQSILSIDTYHAKTAEAALEAGVDILNDISAATADTAMADLALQWQAPIILMHMRGTPKNMQANTEYANVVEEVACYLQEKAESLRRLGLAKNKIILDSGIGFAKQKEHNLQLLQNLSTLTGAGYPVLLAASRKTTIGQVLGELPPEERLEGTLATSCQAVYEGAQMIRVHDVKENVRVVRMLEAILKCQ